MKRVVLYASVALSILGAHSVRADDLRIDPQQKKVSKSSEKNRKIVIHVAPGDWGGTRPEEIETVLNAVADTLLVHFPNRQLHPIIVSPTRQNPIVLYQKGPENSYQVHLAAKDRRWAEFIYEFSHELFHILANYEGHAPPRMAPQLWFEETLCEAVSLYTLRQLSASWEQAPPRAEWVSYASTLNRYTGRVMGEPHRQLPAGMSLEQWFRKNGPELLGNPYLRGKNELVANLFLPILEHNQDWQAVGFLNRDAPQQQTGFYDYLVSWNSRTPPEHQEFTHLAMRMFHFDAPATDAQALHKAQVPAATSQGLGAAGSIRE